MAISGSLLDRLRIPLSLDLLLNQRDEIGWTQAEMLSEYPDGVKRGAPLTALQQTDVRRV